MRKSIFCIALAAVSVAPLSTVAQGNDTDNNTDNNKINHCQNNSPLMFSNIDLTPEQQQMLSALENPFAEDFLRFRTDKSRASMAAGEIPDRCGGDPRFQSGHVEFDPVLAQHHQQLIDARVEYLQRLSHMLTPEQYEQFIANLDSMGRVE